MNKKEREELNKQLELAETHKDCKHKSVVGEYISQPYGTCLVCGRTIFKQNTKT
jgi:hypothetical protein